MVCVNKAPHSTCLSCTHLISRDVTFFRLDLKKKYSSAFFQINYLCSWIHQIHFCNASDLYSTVISSTFVQHLKKIQSWVIMIGILLWNALLLRFDLDIDSTFQCHGYGFWSPFAHFINYSACIYFLSKATWIVIFKP